MPFVKGEQPKGSTPFKKGQSGNPGGRPKGIKKQVKELLTKHLPGIEKEMENATPHEKIQILSSLTDLVGPFKGVV